MKKEDLNRIKGNYLYMEHLKLLIEERRQWQALFEEDREQITAAGYQMPDFIADAKKYEDRIEDLKKENREIIESINQVGEKYKRILLAVYVAGMTQQETARALGYTYGHIRHLHAEAVKEYEKATAQNLYFIG